MRKLHNSLIMFHMLFFCMLAGCSDEGDSPETGGRPDARIQYAHAIHLDPKMKNGQSLTDLLSKRREVVYSQRFGEGFEDNGWLFENASVKMEPEGSGVSIDRQDEGKSPDGFVRLVHKGELDTDTFNTVELVMRYPFDRTAMLRWKRGGEGGGAYYGQNKLIGGSKQFQVVSFYMGANPDWRGVLSKLDIAPERNKRAGFRLVEIRFVDKGFEPGATRLAAGSGDGGLFCIGKELRRAWPSDLGVPLYAQCTVPDRACFSASICLPLVRSDPPVRFVLDVKVDDMTWKRVHEERVNEVRQWFPFDAELAGFTGQETEFRLTVLKDNESVDAIKEPETATCFWASPTIYCRNRIEVDARDRETTQMPNVLLVTMDTTRADHVGDPKHTPCLAALAKEGIGFENAWSNCNSTSPSHASILTGRYNVEHGLHSNFALLADDNKLLSERFRDKGYTTAAAVSVPHLDAPVGFGQGFDYFNRIVRAPLYDGRHTADQALAWLDEWETRGVGPFFFWLHIFDPHTPYASPKSFIDDYAERLDRPVPSAGAEPPSMPLFAEGYNGHHVWLEGVTNHDRVVFLYSAGVSYADYLVGRVLDRMKSTGFYDNTVVVVTADHGESLGEHDIWYEHYGLFEEVTRVPLIVRVPGGPRGLTVDATVTTLDIAPTLARLCGLENDPVQQGMDLLDVAVRDEALDRRLWFEYAQQLQIGTRDSRYFFVTTFADTPFSIEPDEQGRRFFGQEQILPKGTHFLFDHVSRPGLDQNIAHDEPEKVQGYLRLLTAWHKQLKSGKTTQRAMSDEEKERLRQLGYGGY